MPAAYKHPVHFTSPVSTNYRTNYESIFRKTIMADENETTPATSEDAAPAPKKRGRPKGSKNKPKEAHESGAAAASTVVPVAGTTPSVVHTPQSGDPAVTPQHSTGVKLKTIDVPGTSQPAGSTSANPSAGRVVVAPTAVVAVPVPETPEEREERLQEEADAELARAEAQAEEDSERAQERAKLTKPHGHGHKAAPRDED